MSGAPNVTIECRRTRFDGEADVVLFLALSVFVARTTGGWLFAVGAIR